MQGHPLKTLSTKNTKSTKTNRKREKPQQPQMIRRVLSGARRFVFHFVLFVFFVDSSIFSQFHGSGSSTVKHVRPGSLSNSIAPWCWLT
jgi:hypothetical protein